MKIVRFSIMNRPNLSILCIFIWNKFWKHRFFFQGSNLEKFQVPPLKSLIRVQMKRLTKVSWKPNNLNYTAKWRFSYRERFKKLIAFLCTHLRAVGNWGAGGPVPLQFLVDQLTISQPGGHNMLTTLLRAPSPQIFRTSDRIVILLVSCKKGAGKGLCPYSFWQISWPYLNQGP